jgi:hypothetical protein
MTFKHLKNKRRIRITITCGELKDLSIYTTVIDIRNGLFGQIPYDNAANMLLRELELRKATSYEASGQQFSGSGDKYIMWETPDFQMQLQVMP